MASRHLIWYSHDLGHFASNCSQSADASDSGYVRLGSRRPAEEAQPSGPWTVNNATQERPCSTLNASSEVSDESSCSNLEVGR